MQPGDFAVVNTGGSLVARLIRWATRSPVNHAFVYVGGGQIIEAEPNGAQLADVRKYPDAIWADVDLTQPERTGIVSWARGHLGTPYSWVDDLEVGLVDVFGWAPKFMRDRLASTATLQCAQLVDAAYAAAGVQLFDDGRPCGGVSPGDLYHLITASKEPQ